MPVCRDSETAGFAGVPGVGLGRHNAGGVVEKDLNGILAVIRVEGEGEGAGGVEAVEIGDGW